MTCTMNDSKAFQLPPTFGSVQPAKMVPQDSTSSSDQSVPAELTLNGTTPSGKPRLYVCNICTRAFARQEHLKRHERSHTKEKPYACSICSRKFSRRDLLLRHSTKLHAGASEVVPRLRKRSVKASSSPFAKSAENSEENSPEGEILSQPTTTKTGARKMKRVSTGGPLAGSSVVSKPLAQISKRSSSIATAFETQLRLENDATKERNAIKNPDYKLEFPLNRRASFSAMSGLNYALPTSEPYATETVEFSTPQLFAFDDESENWLNSLSNLDLMDPRQSQNQQALAQQQLSTQQQQHARQQLLPHLQGDNGIDIKSAQADEVQVPLPEALMKESDNITGYSFYDVPSRNVGSLFTFTSKPIDHSSSNEGAFDDQIDPMTVKEEYSQKLKSHYSPMLQESPETDSSLNTQPGTEKVKNWQETLFNQNINDLEAITDLNVSKTYDVPQGYSFYGNSEQNTIPNSSSCSSNATISPILLDNAHSVNSVNSRQDSNGHYVPSHANHHLAGHLKQDPNSHSNPLRDFGNEFTYSKDRFEKYSRVNLFTSTIRTYIHQSLSKYPFLGVPSPSIPDNERLNFYTQEFKNKFLNHHPFIHRSMLNEYSLMKVTLKSLEPNLIRDENSIDNTRVSLVCLPLLIATIGAIVSNKKSDAASLYEASRRCIHVYLDTRKKLVRAPEPGDSKATSSNNSSPLWLIQSLTLSVVYGLFADDEISLNVIIRQVNALNSLIKTSGLNSVSMDHLSGHDIDESYMDNFINYESTVRTIHMIFHISSLLSTLYNIVPSLKIENLMIDLPTSTLLWDCSSISEFENLINSFDFKPEKFQRVINGLLNLPFNNIDPQTGLIGDMNFFFDNHVSEFGLVCLQNGLHQLAYLRQLTSVPENNGSPSSSPSLMTLSGSGEDQRLVQVAKNWDTLLSTCKLYDEKSEVFIDSKLLNYHLGLKLSGVMSLNRIKENVWLRSFNDINELYFNSFNYGEAQLKNEAFRNELVWLLDNSANILKYVFFQRREGGDSGNIATEYPQPLQELYDPELGDIDMKFMNKISIDSQLLFDVFLIAVSFLINFENVFKAKMKYNGMGSVSFLQHFELRSTVFNGSNGEAGGSEIDDVLFKYYLKFFKIYLNLEYFLKLSYEYHDFESEFSSLTISNIINNEKLQISPDEKNLNSVLRDETTIRDKDLIINELIQFKLPFKFLKVGSFMFKFIYDKRLKFVNFKNLSDLLFHLRVFLESRDEYV